MNVDLWWAELQVKASGMVQSLTYDQLYYLWLGSGILIFMTWVWWVHGVMRRAFGHVNFRGTWYNDDEAEVLVKMIDEDCQRGNRVMRHDEMALLRRWRFGEDKTYGLRQSGYL